MRVRQNNGIYLQNLVDVLTLFFLIIAIKVQNINLISENTLTNYSNFYINLMTLSKFIKSVCFLKQYNPYILLVLDYFVSQEISDPY